jgi:hypothetical protein
MSAITFSLKYAAQGANRLRSAAGARRSFSQRPHQPSPAGFKGRHASVQASADQGKLGRAAQQQKPSPPIPCCRPPCQRALPPAGAAESRLSQLQQREAEYKSQLDSLKAAALEANAAALSAAAAAASTSGRLSAEAGGADLAGLRQRLESAVAAMQQGLVERDTEVRLLLLAALAGEHILYIGPPGTAKSELGRRLSRLCHGSYFERLLTRFSVPEELFGPLSMRALEEDMYVRQTRG